VSCQHVVGSLLVCWEVDGRVMFGSRQVVGRLLLRCREVLVAGC